MFAVWLTDKRRLALSPAGTIVRDPHHRESRHAVSRIFLLFLNILIILPKAAETIIVEALRSRSIHIQRRRVHEALNVVDPVIRTLRRTVTIIRRKYNAASPNALCRVVLITKVFDSSSN